MADIEVTAGIFDALEQKVSTPFDGSSSECEKEENYSSAGECRKLLLCCFKAHILSSQGFELSGRLDGYSHMTGMKHISPLDRNKDRRR